MRGNYSLSDCEISIWKPIFEEKIQKIINEEINSWKLTNEDLSPANIDWLLTKYMGYNQDSFDANGWQQDTWYNYSKNDIKLCLYYCGFTFEMELYKDY